MRKIVLLFICGCLVLSSCSTGQLGAAATGTSLGGMFGSSIGGLSGGYRGHQIGQLVGMTTGAAVGIAAATPKTNNSKDKKTCNEVGGAVEYGDYEPSKSGNNAYANAHPLEVTRVVFTDANNNHFLEANESGALEIIFFNRSNATLYNVTPKIDCDTRHIEIAALSPAKEIQPQQRVRYRVDLVGKKKLKDGTVRFDVMVKNGKVEEIVKSFEIQTRR